MKRIRESLECSQEIDEETEAKEFKNYAAEFAAHSIDYNIIKLRNLNISQYYMKAVTSKIVVIYVRSAFHQNCKTFI